MNFQRLWTPVFWIFRIFINLSTTPTRGRLGLLVLLVHALNAVRFSDFLWVTLGLSPYSPKPRPYDGRGPESGAGRVFESVPVELAEKGLGECGWVPIPVLTWRKLVAKEAVAAMSNVRFSRQPLSESEEAMVRALAGQGHLELIQPGVQGFGLGPSAPIFLIPKSSEKCSFIVNCRRGNQLDRSEQPKMSLPTLYSLARRFVKWASDSKLRRKQRFVITVDLTNCFPSMRVPEEVWGTFRVQGPDGVYDLRSLPFGWKLSPPICQHVVGEHVRQALTSFPPPAGYDSALEVPHDHYLDDLILVESDPDWLRACGRWLLAVLVLAGFVISKKSMVEPASRAKWLGKVVDVQGLVIENDVMLVAKIISAVISLYDAVVPVQQVQRILGLINWLAAPGKGHLPFLAGIYSLLSYQRSRRVRVTPRFWISVVQAVAIAAPAFHPPPLLVGDWRLVKWIAVDGAGFFRGDGSVGYRVGLYDPVGGARPLFCPHWVDNQQVAELYGVWQLLKWARVRKIPQLAMMQDNMQAIWGALNLRARSVFWKQNRILRAIVLLLRDTQIILHVVYCPTHIQPADPVSRVRSHSRAEIQRAAEVANKRWSFMISQLHQLQYKGVSFVNAN